MKMEQTKCSEKSVYKNSDAGELPRRKHTIFVLLKLMECTKVHFFTVTVTGIVN